DELLYSAYHLKESLLFSNNFISFYFLSRAAEGLARRCPATGRRKLVSVLIPVGVIPEDEKSPPINRHALFLMECVFYLSGFWTAAWTNRSERGEASCRFHAKYRLMASSAPSICW